MGKFLLSLFRCTINILVDKYLHSVCVGVSLLSMYVCVSLLSVSIGVCKLITILHQHKCFVSVGSFSLPDVAL